MRACHQERPETIPLEAIAKVLTARASGKPVAETAETLTIEGIGNPKVDETDIFPLSLVRWDGQEVLTGHLPVDGCDTSLWCW